MAIYKSILDLVGGTPLVELTQFEKRERPESNCFGQAGVF